MTNDVNTTTKVVPVATSTLKRNKRNQPPKANAANITDLTEKKAEKKSSKKVTKAEKKPVVKPAKLSKTLTALPVRNLEAKEFVPNWVYANLPDVLHEPSDQKFSFLALYLKVRDLAATEGKIYYELTVGELLDLLKKYAEANPKTAIGERILNLNPLQLRDLKARLQWLAVETLRRWDAQVRERQDQEAEK